MVPIRAVGVTIVLVLACTAAENVIPRKFDPQVLGSTLTDSHNKAFEAFASDYPFHVTLSVKQADGQLLRACNGVLVNYNWVLTSLHCARQSQVLNRDVIASMGVSNFVNNSQPSSRFDTPVLYFVEGIKNRDLAMAKLASPAYPASDFVKPVTRGRGETDTLQEHNHAEQVRVIGVGCRDVLQTGLQDGGQLFDCDEQYREVVSYADAEFVVSGKAGDLIVQSGLNSALTGSAEWMYLTNSLCMNDWGGGILLWKNDEWMLLGIASSGAPLPITDAAAQLDPILTGCGAAIGLSIATRTTNDGMPEWIDETMKCDTPTLNIGSAERGALTSVSMCFTVPDGLDFNELHVNFPTERYMLVHPKGTVDFHHLRGMTSTGDISLEIVGTEVQLRSASNFDVGATRVVEVTLGAFYLPNRCEEDTKWTVGLWNCPKVDILDVAALYYRTCADDAAWETEFAATAEKFNQYNRAPVSNVAQENCAFCENDASALTEYTGVTNCELCNSCKRLFNYNDHNLSYTCEIDTQTFTRKERESYHYHHYDLDTPEACSRSNPQDPNRAVIPPPMLCKLPAVRSGAMGNGWLCGPNDGNVTSLRANDWAQEADECWPQCPAQWTTTGSLNCGVQTGNFTESDIFSECKRNALFITLYGTSSHAALHGSYELLDSSMWTVAPVWKQMNGGQDNYLFYLNGAWRFGTDYNAEAEVLKAACTGEDQAMWSPLAAAAECPEGWTEDDGSAMVGVTVTLVEGMVCAAAACPNPSGQVIRGDIALDVCNDGSMACNVTWCCEDAPQELEFFGSDSYDSMSGDETTGFYILEADQAQYGLTWPVWKRATADNWIYRTALKWHVGDTAAGTDPSKIFSSCWYPVNPAYAGACSSWAESPTVSNPFPTDIVPYMVVRVPLPPPPAADFPVDNCQTSFEGLALVEGVNHTVECTTTGCSQQQVWGCPNHHVTVASRVCESLSLAGVTRAVVQMSSQAGNGGYGSFDSCLCGSVTTNSWSAYDGVRIFPESSETTLGCSAIDNVVVAHGCTETFEDLMGGGGSDFVVECTSATDCTGAVVGCPSDRVTRDTPVCRTLGLLGVQRVHASYSFIDSFPSCTCTDNGNSLTTQNLPQSQPGAVLTPYTGEPALSCN